MGYLRSDALLGLREVVRVYLESNAIAAPFRGCNRRRACSQEGVKHCIADETEHTNKTLG
jgi:hypothetical protein